jgi:hypothetical protein
MGATGNIAAAMPNAISAFSSLAGGYASSQAARAEGNIARMQGHTNAKIAEMQAKDAIERGTKESYAHKTKVRQLIGEQRAAAAAQGIDVSSESVTKITSDTAYYGELDAATIRNNAYREAFGYKTQARSSRAQAEIDYVSSRGAARSSLLTGGMQAAGYGAEAYRAYKTKKDE